jgi:hypothetical protein
VPRDAHARTRLLDAADGFSTGTLAALSRARIAAGEIKKNADPLDDESGWWRQDIRVHLDAANEAVDEVLAKQARVHLLFGDQSPTGVAATAVGTRLRNLGGTLEQRPDSIRDHNTMSAYSRYFDQTRAEHERFNRAALAALKETWWQRLRERWRKPKQP